MRVVKMKFVLGKGVEAVENRPPWVLRQASHLHMRQWIAFAKNSLAASETTASRWL
jgi:hypothetical protein